MEKRWRSKKYDKNETPFSKPLSNYSVCLLIRLLWSRNKTSRRSRVQEVTISIHTMFLFDRHALNNNDILFADTTNMPFNSWLLYTMQCFVLEYLMRPTAWWSSFFRTMYNNLMRLSLFLLEKYPYFAIQRYGEKFAKVNIFKQYNLNQTREKTISWQLHRNCDAQSMWNARLWDNYI